MDIVKNEICKLLTKRTVLILLFLLVLNPVLGLYTMNTVNDDGYTGKDYSALYGEISNYSREDVLPEIEQRQMTAEAYGRISLCSRASRRNTSRSFRSCWAWTSIPDSACWRSCADSTPNQD